MIKTFWLRMTETEVNIINDLYNKPLTTIIISDGDNSSHAY